MSYDTRDLARVRNAVLAVSAAAWLVLLAAPASSVMHCPAMRSGAAPSFQMLLAMNTPSALAAGWALMLVAMMFPILIPAICHIRLRSFGDRRARSVAIFVSGYVLVWMAAGVVLQAAALAIGLAAKPSYLQAVAVLLVACVWQFSPLKQLCLNRCHAQMELPAFGAAADLGVFRFGAIQGIACVGSCWALMLFPLLLPQGHVIAMMGVAVLVFSERLETPSTARWGWRGLGRMKRIVIRQARLRVAALGETNSVFTR